MHKNNRIQEPFLLWLMIGITCGGDYITVAVVVRVHDESAGQRQLVRHLDGLDRLPAVDQVVHRPTVCKKSGTTTNKRCCFMARK